MALKGFRILTVCTGNICRSPMAEGMQLFNAGKAHLMSRFDSANKAYDIPDPIGGELDLYIESAALIKNCLGGIYSYLGERIDA